MGSGPRVVAVGGGHGLSASLRAVRRFAGDITAVVSVADDGGSSGRLREQIPDLPAPGDIRKCLGALADESEPFGALLELRLAEGPLAGHALGNLLLVVLALECGSFPDAVDELGARVGAVGRVLPATSEAVELEGRDPGAGGSAVVGQVAVHNTPGIRRVRLRPEAPASPPAVAAAIESADQVVVGPGSLFTSVLAAAVVPAVRGALATTAAQRVYVANLRTQVPETEGFTVADELSALAEHGIEVDAVVVDPARLALDGGPGEGLGGVAGSWRVAPVAADDGAVHDPVRLGAVLAALAVADPSRRPSG